ncbi:MAG: dockerin type I domain-containing protein, partial [Ruminococcus sp.]
GKLTNIDLSNNPLLETLWCSSCNLPFMNLDAQTAVTDFRKPSGISSANIIGETFDMAQFPEGFDISRVTSVQNAVLDGTVLTVINPRQPIEYTYNAGGAVGEITYKISISSVELTSVLAREIPPQEYTGSEIRPVPELYCGEEQITAIDTEYNNNIEIGTASVTVTMDEHATLYKGTVTLEFEIVKAAPEYEVPTGLSAAAGQKLGTIKLPEGFSWEAPDTVLDSAGTVTATVSYAPEDTEHYNFVGGIKVSVTVTEPLKGDVNTDGKIDVIDATLILSYYAKKGSGLEPVFSNDASENEKMLLLADVNEDGKIDLTDASLILKYYAYTGAGIDISWEDILK